MNNNDVVVFPSASWWDSDFPALLETSHAVRTGGQQECHSNGISQQSHIRHGCAYVCSYTGVVWCICNVLCSLIPVILC